MTLKRVMVPYWAYKSTLFQWEWILMIVYLNDIYGCHNIIIDKFSPFWPLVVPPGGATDAATTFLIRTLSFEGLACWS